MREGPSSAPPQPDQPLARLPCIAKDAQRPVGRRGVGEERRLEVRLSLADDDGERAEWAIAVDGILADRATERLEVRDRWSS